MRERFFVVNNKEDSCELMSQLKTMGATWPGGNFSTDTPDSFGRWNAARVYVSARDGGGFQLTYTGLKPYVDTRNVFVKGMKLEQKGDSIVIKEDKHSKLMYKIKEMEDKLAELKKEAVDSLKEEKKYCVVLPDPQRKQKGLYGTALSRVSDGRIFIVDTNHNSVISNDCYHLTESEIKANHDWAWQFAKEVD